MGGTTETKALLHGLAVRMPCKNVRRTLVHGGECLGNRPTPLGLSLRFSLWVAENEETGGWQR
eukprot:3711478-Lingulodinium_polyedra.AAC.1